MEIYKNILQYSNQYWKLRQGRLTASNAQAIANNGKGLETYIYKILAEKYSNHDNYQSDAMKRGSELEEVARDVYTIETGNKVEQVGMITEGDYVSCSPDGLLKDGKGGLEIKCVNKVKHFKILMNGESEIDKKYIYQCQMSMLISKRKQWQLIFYHPDFEKSLIMFKITPDEEIFAKLRAGIKTGIELLKDYDEKFKKVNK